MRPAAPPAEAGLGCPLPSLPVAVSLYADGSGTAVVTALANTYRSDVQAAGYGNGVYGFSIDTPAALSSGTHSLAIRPTATAAEVLYTSPRTISCSAVSHDYRGWLDGADCNSVHGWAADLDFSNVAQTVTLYVDGVATTTTGVASIFRQDVASANIGTGFYGFSIPSPPVPRDRKYHTVQIYVGNPGAGLMLPSSVVFNYTCGPYQVFGVCSVPRPTISTLPSINGSNLYVATGGQIGITTTDQLNVTVDVAVENYTFGASAYTASGGLFVSQPTQFDPSSHLIVGNLAPNNALVSRHGKSNDSVIDYVNLSGLDTGNSGNYYFATGWVTVDDCDTPPAEVTDSGVVTNFSIHVDSPVVISNVSTVPNPLIAGQAGQVTITGSNFGLSGNVEFTGPTSSSSSSTTTVAYTVSNPGQAVVYATLQTEGTYNVGIVEGVDTLGFNLASQGGQAGRSSTTKQVDVQGHSVKPSVKSSLNQYNNPSQQLSQIDPNLRLPISLNCAMIDGTPSMPQITAQVVDAMTGQPVISGTAEFNLHLQFNQMTGTPNGVQTVPAQQYT